MIKKFLIYLLIIFIHTQLIICDYCNNKLETSITQKIENEGFHREIRWLIEIAPKTQEILKENECKLALRLDVSQGMYVNPDEIAELNRSGNISALIIDGTVDIELPSHLARPHKLYIYLPEGNGENKILLQFPIHLRYQRAQISGGFGKVVLEKPSLLLNCQQKLSGFCETIQAICNPIVNNINNCSWSNVSYQALFDEVELLVPVGDLDDYPLISIITLLLGCAGCIYILSVLSTTPL